MVIFSKSRRTITANEIAEFIRDGVYFEQSNFQPPPGTVESLEVDWGKLQFASEAGVVTFHQQLDADLQPGIDAILDSLFPSTREPGSKEDWVAAHLQQSQQAIEVESESDAKSIRWMLEGLQRFLTSEYEAIVYRPHDGFYGANLEPILLIV